MSAALPARTRAGRWRESPRSPTARRCPTDRRTGSREVAEAERERQLVNDQVAGLDGLQFEPQLTLDELRVWNRELAGDYELMGDRFDPAEEAARNLREFTAYAPLYERQMARMLRALLHQMPA